MSADLQLDLLGGPATPVDTAPTPAAPAHVQGALFRPDFAAMRPPKTRRRPKPVVLDPALHDSTLT